MKLSRRKFLCGVSALAISVATASPEALAWPVHGNFSPAFNGNPNVTISAINTAGGIACSRAVSPSTAGAIPCFIQASAKNITATGTSRPYEDLSYVWNFGDPLGVETFTNPVTNGSVNANTGQTGPEAAYVYRSAGTYTVTLTIVGQNGLGFTSTSVTQQIIVGAFSPATTFYCDSASAGTNSGTQANPFTSMSSLNTALSSATTPVQVFLAQGSNFGGASGAATGMVLPNGKSNIHVTSYVGAGGAGLNPIITVNGATSAVNLGTPTGGGNRDDIIVSNLTLTNAAGFSSTQLIGVVYGNGPLNYTNVYVDNCTLTDTVAPSGFCNYSVSTNGTTPVSTGWGVWNCTSSSPQSGGLNSHGIFLSGGPSTAWWFVMGGSITGGANPASANVLLHHIYPNCRYNSLYRWINFGAGGAGANQRNYCINTNWDNTNAGGDNSGTLQDTQYYLISDNMMTGTLRAHDLGNANNNVNTVQYSNVVCQSNALANLSSATAVLFSNAVSYTFRDNNAWNSTGVFVPNGFALPIASFRLYRNKFYTPIGETGQPISLSEPVVVVTSTIASSQLTLNNLFMPVNAIVTVSGSSDANIPNGNYFVVAQGFVSGSSFFVSLGTTLGGAAINAAANGTMTLTGHIANTMTITDNKIQDQRSSTNLSNITISFSDLTGALIDRNSYYAPNQAGWNAASTLLFFDISTQKTFTQWQSAGFDTNGTLPLSGFGWVNPAAGQF